MMVDIFASGFLLVVGFLACVLGLMRILIPLFKDVYLAGIDAADAITKAKAKE